MSKCKIHQWLSKYGSYMYTRSLADEINNVHDIQHLLMKPPPCALNSIVYDSISRMTEDAKTYTRSEVLKNVCSVNIRQYNRLSSRSANLQFLAPERKCWDESVSRRAWDTRLRQYTIYNILDKTMESKPCQRRSIVLYYRGSGPSSEEIEFGCDTFQFTLIYRCVEYLINQGMLRLFNKVYVVSRTDWLPEAVYKLAPDIHLVKGNNDHFIANTCLFANTIHFFGGELPDAWLYNIPITGLLYSIVDYGKHIPNGVTIPFLNYSGTIDNKTKEYIPDTELEHIIDDEWKSWANILSSDYNLNNQNTTVDNITKYLYQTLRQVEDMLIEDTIVCN
jgi:hypothetical protein